MLVQTSIHDQNKGNQWYVDNGFSSHMTCDKKTFLTFKEVNEVRLTFGDNDTTRIAGKGTLSIKNGNTKIKKVLYVEGLKHNLLIVNQLCHQGNNITFQSQGYEIGEKSLRILVTNSYRTSNNVYILNGTKGEKFYMGQIDESWLWYRIMGHINFHNLVKINTKQVVRDMPNIAKPSNIVWKQ
jgi:hypothetical protein